MLSFAAQFLRRKKRSKNKVLPDMLSDRENRASAYIAQADADGDIMGEENAQIRTICGPIPQTCKDGLTTNQISKPAIPMSKADQTFEGEESYELMLDEDAQLKTENPFTPKMPENMTGGNIINIGEAGTMTAYQGHLHGCRREASSHINHYKGQNQEDFICSQTSKSLRVGDHNCATRSVRGVGNVSILQEENNVDMHNCSHSSCSRVERSCAPPQMLARLSHKDGLDTNRISKPAIPMSKPEQTFQGKGSYALLFDEGAQPKTENSCTPKMPENKKAGNIIKIREAATMTAYQGHLPSPRRAPSSHINPYKGQQEDFTCSQTLKSLRVGEHNCATRSVAGLGNVSILQEENSGDMDNCAHSSGSRVQRSCARPQMMLARLSQDFRDFPEQTILSSGASSSSVMVGDEICRLQNVTGMESGFILEEGSSNEIEDSIHSSLNLNQRRAVRPRTLTRVTESFFSNYEQVPVYSPASTSSVTVSRPNSLRVPYFEM